MENKHGEVERKLLPHSTAKARTKVTVQSFGLTFANKDQDESMDLTGHGAPATFEIKEGVEYRMKLHYKVDGGIVSGLQLQTVVQRMIFTETLVCAIGTCGPNQPGQPHYEYVGPVIKAPKGILSRGRYTATTKLTDGDTKCYREWQWSYDIVKDWE